MNLFIEESGKLIIKAEEYPSKLETIRLHEYDRARLVDADIAHIPPTVEMRIKIFRRIPYTLHGWTIWTEDS